MHRLRPSLLFRGTERVLTVALVGAAQAVFLWMFLSADPLEKAAASEQVLRFAADWRHGMAGNAWIYMPGFFATAAAVWLRSLRGPPAATAVDIIIVLPAAFCLAALASARGTPIAASDLWISTGIALPSLLPRPSSAGALQGLYTLATWTVFVLACRTALARRSWWPFAAPAVLSIGLALIRPWTVDDFVGLWRSRVAAGDTVACASLVAVGALAALLAVAAHRSQRRSNPPYAAGVRRAEITSSR